MAYSTDEYRVQVRGSLSDGAESFYNTWTIMDLVGGQDVNDVGSMFESLYADLYDAEVSSHTVAVGARATNLGDDTVTDFTSWGPITGSDLADALPSQLAVRISLAGNAGVHGGPFIAGFSKNAITPTGLFDNATDIATAVSDFITLLNASDWGLRIDRPTISTTENVLSGRVGQRFDVIRKRANDIAEAYVTIAF